MRTAALGVIAALALAAGCEKSAPTCEAAVAHLSSMSKATGSGEVPAAGIDQLVQVCKDKQWNAATRRCLGTAETPEAAQTCLQEKR